MSVLVIAASGGIGSQVVKQLLENGTKEVKILLRSEKSLNIFTEQERTNPALKVFYGSILDLSDDKLQEMMTGCEAVVSGLGHRLTFSGMFFPPRALCTDAAKKIHRVANKVYDATEDPEKRKIKVICVNTVGTTRPDGLDNPQRSVGAYMVLGLLRWTIPPHTDNCKLVDYFHNVNVKKLHHGIEFCAVRPDGLLDEPKSDYVVFDRLQNGLFSPKVTNRATCASFMVDCIINDAVWNQWKNNFPVVLNANQAITKK